MFVFVCVCVCMCVNVCVCMCVCSHYAFVVQLEVTSFTLNYNTFMMLCILTQPLFYVMYFVLTHFFSNVEGFPMQKGRQDMAFVPFPEVHCQTVRFRPYSFYPDKAIQVQVTVNHFNTTSKSFVHDPAMSWTENINYEGFDVCVAQAGRGDRSSRGMVAIDWMAYQGAPEGGVAGTTRVQQWWTGTECETVGLPSVSSCCCLF